jgi:hypothetical protein
MAHTYEELKAMTVAQLRDVAAGLSSEAVQGYTQLNKEHLLAATCKALNIDMHEHRKVIGVDKSSVKAEIHKLRTGRDNALVAHDHKQLKSIRRQIHDLKKKLHRSAALVK